MNETNVKSQSGNPDSDINSAVRADLDRCLQRTLENGTSGTAELEKRCASLVLLGGENHAALQQWAFDRFLAVRRKPNSPVIKILVAAGVHHYASDAKSGAGPIHVMSIVGNLNGLQQLLANGADIESTCHGGRTALHIAVDAGDFGMAFVLVSNGADVNAAASDGSRPLHLAAGMDPSVGMIMLPVLASHGANPTLRRLDGKTPRECAELEGNPAMSPYFVWIERAYAKNTPPAAAA